MKDELFSVQDKLIVITGGLGKLGAFFADVLLERGARVAVWDVTASENAVLSEERRIIQKVDVTSSGSIKCALRVLVEKWGVPEGLVNNAAIDSPPDAPLEDNGPFETFPEASWNRVFDVNVKGVFLCCKLVGTLMANQGRGSIVNISSTYGLVSPDQRLYEKRRANGEIFFKPPAYSASKSALLNFTRYLATYWAPKGVRVNTITFGGVEDSQERAFIEAYSNRTPLGRMALPHDYAGGMVFLLSQASSYMTGANLVIDGGWTAW